MAVLRMSGAHRRIGLVLLVFAAGLPLPAQDPPHHTYTVADGLPSNTVYCAAQDEQGYMWFGTDAGVCRYDGDRFERFTATDGLADNEVLQLFADQQGQVWFTGLNGQLSWYANGRFHNAKDHPELKAMRPAAALDAICDDGAGGIWAGGLEGDLYHWNGGVLEHHRMQDHRVDPPASSVVRLLPVTKDSLLILCGGSLYAVEDGQPRYLRSWPIGPPYHPAASTRNGLTVARSDSGLVRIGRDKDDVLLPMGGFLLPSNKLPLFIDRWGTLWFGWEAGGVVRIRDLTGKPEAEHWFASDNVVSVSQDHEGNIWVLTDGNGVHLITPAQLDLRIYAASADTRAASVASTLWSPRLGVVFGTAHGQICRLENGRVQVLTGPIGERTSRDRIRMLDEAPDGDLWVATDEWFGRLLGTPPSMEQRPIPMIDERFPGIAPRLHGMKSLTIGMDGRVVASLYGLAEVIDTLGERMACFRGALCWDSRRAYAPFLDSSGTLWSENEKRLRCNTRDTVRDFPHLDVEFGVRITSIAELGQGTLVVGSAGGGVKLVRDGRVVRRYAAREGLCSEQVRRVRVRNGRILVATDGGAALIDDALGHGELTNWTVATGLPTNDVQDIDTDGRTLWLATAAGLCAVPLARSKHWTRPPVLRFIRCMVGDSAYAIRDRIQVPLGTRLQLEARAFTFGSPEGTRYAFKEADDAAWAELTSGTITLARPEAGLHHLLVRVRRADSPWSVPIGLTVEVLLPWHATWWARGLLAIVLFLGGSLLVRAMVQRMYRQQMLELERQNAQLEERGRIAADIHDDLGADISNLLMFTRQSSESRSLGAVDRDNLTTIEHQANGLIQKIDEVIWSLDPQDDHVLPTLQFIQRHAELFAEQQGWVFRTKPLDLQRDAPLPSRLRRELYLLVKELLSNIAKHTDTRSLRFEVAFTGEHLSIVIEDDGRPRTPDGQGRNGHGLANIRKRLERTGGTLFKTSIGPPGTRCELSFPITDPSQ